MKVITLHIIDEKYAFFMDMIQKLDFVKVKTATNKSKKIIEDFKEALSELQQIKAGKKKATKFEDFLNELNQEDNGL